MELNYLAIILAVIAQFIIGFIWYGPIFGSLWGKIHGFDKLPKEQQQKMMNEMGPYYMAQLAVTILTTVILAMFITLFPAWDSYTWATFCWLGFVVPAQFSAVIFGGTDRKWIAPKILVQAGGSFLCYMAAAYTLSTF